MPFPRLIWKFVYAKINKFSHLQSNQMKRTLLEYISEMIIWKLNLLIRFSNGGIMHSFFKCPGWNSIFACRLPERLYRCHHFWTEHTKLYNCFQCLHVSASIFQHTKQTRQIEIHQSQPTGMTFWTCGPLHKVTWNCDWCISIRNLFCMSKDACGNM